MMFPDDDGEALAQLDARIRTLLPEQYHQCYDTMQPTPMGSAGLRYGADGKVAWDEMWASFCDLAMAGGPPHKGFLLEPGTQAEIDAAPDRYRDAADEITRGITLVTRLQAQAAPDAGWVRVFTGDETMAGWLHRAITMENVAVRADADAIDLPCSPAFRLEREIKNDITVIAKTTHYWSSHIPVAQQDAIDQLFLEWNDEAPLIAPDRDALRADCDAARARMAEAIQQATGLPPTPNRYPGWLGVVCATTELTVWMMRALVASNVLSRREGTALFMPIDLVHDTGGTRVIAATTRLMKLATLKGLTSRL